MTSSRCTCGFRSTDAETLTDHLAEMFGPSDDTDQTGQFHAEAIPGTCLCGYTASTGACLDAHLLAAFTPPDHLGRDGRQHNPTEEAPQCATVRA